MRDYNEDRVSIILNVARPPDKQSVFWPKTSFFGLYDGHAGAACADWLRDNLHNYVLKESTFPAKPRDALMNGFAKAEADWCKLAGKRKDNSGSCAIVVLVVGDMCHVANVGDSRGIMSGERGRKIYPLSKDHKPSSESEQARIKAAGGKIYQTRVETGEESSLLGPHRVLPGRLSVSRSFGDLAAKKRSVGGNPNVVTAIPDIKSFRIKRDFDYILIASDGVWDKLSNKEVS